MYLSAALSDLQNANRELEADIEHEKEMEQARTNFFSAVSHELKTPITIMKGQLEGMQLHVRHFFGYTADFQYRFCNHARV